MEENVCFIPGDLRDENLSKYIAETTMKTFGKIDILVNNCGVQFPQDSILNISSQQLKDTFETNIYTIFLFDKGSASLFKRKQQHYKHNIYYCI